MKKTFIYFLLLCPIFGISQALPIDGCSEPACDEQKLKELLAGTEAALYEFYGFRYNDSIYLEVHPVGDSIVFKNCHTWISEESLEYYTKIIAAGIDYQRLKPEGHYRIIHLQSLPKKGSELEDKPNIKRPVPLLADDFNATGQKAAYNYFYHSYLHQKLGAQNFNDIVQVEFIMKAGKLAAINFIDPPLDQRMSMKFAKEAKEIEMIHLDLKSVEKAGDYRIEFVYGGYYYQDEEDQDLYLQNRLNYYIDGGLWRQLRALINNEEHRAEEPLKIDTSDGLVNFKVYQHLEAKKAEGKIPKRWWMAVPTKKQIEAEKLASEEKDGSASDLEAVPVFKGCDAEKSNEELKLCFQKSTVEHISKTFNYSRELQKKDIQGKVYIQYVVGKDGSIDQIEVVRGVHHLLDLECIRVISEIPACSSPAILDGKAVPISFTVPINAQLK